uniref:Uncharacterized protein n=1 Tax=uncultured prokaryote TaxID=198431 RepID=H5SJX8_9ZZZZ|nr:hypothetical protein HGMM_F38G10C14 [uncultured prokaryote]
MDMSKPLWRIGAVLVMFGVVYALAQKPPAKPLATISVNLKEGETISGTTKVVATVQSDKMVLRVEFSVDDVLREVDESTPYEFEWDTITDAEGERRLKIVAILEGNQTVVKELKVKIDNGSWHGGDGSCGAWGFEAWGGGGDYWFSGGAVADGGDEYRDVSEGVGRGGGGR